MNYPSQKSEYPGPLVKCYVQISGQKDPVQTHAYVIRVFQKDFSFLKLAEGHFLKSAGGFVINRGGVDWPGFLQGVLKCYQTGAPVPRAFKPIVRLPEALVDSSSQVSGVPVIQVFSQLRLRGFLPPFTLLSRQTCPKEIGWANISQFFHDFRNTPWNLPGL